MGSLHTQQCRFRLFIILSFTSITHNFAFSSLYSFILLLAHHFYHYLLACNLLISSSILSHLLALFPSTFIPHSLSLSFTLNLLFIFIFIFILTFYFALRYSVSCSISLYFPLASFYSSPSSSLLPPSSFLLHSLKVIRRVSTDYGQRLYLGTCLQHTLCSYCTRSTTISLSGACNILFR